MENALIIRQKLFSINHPSLDIGCGNVNEANETMENYSSVFLDLKRVVEISQKLLPSNGSNIAITDENIDEADELIGKFFTVISNFEIQLL
jgi:hypothetical protein